jgi:hypothetical protein
MYCWDAESISVTGRGGAEVCETSKLPYYLDTRLTDGGEFAIRTGCTLAPKKDHGTHLCLRSRPSQDLNSAVKIGIIVDYRDFYRNRTQYLPTKRRTLEINCKMMLDWRLLL